YSGSDFKDVLQSAQIKVVRDFFAANSGNTPQAQPRSIVMNDFLQILKERRPSVSAEALRKYNRWADEFKAL
ncbi:MAG: AAA family ATPase, partial [Candidatus Bathyarchaeota archaeon]